MVELLTSWLVLSLVVFGTAAVVPGIEIKDFKGALAVAAIFGILSWALGRVLFVAIGVGTLGLGFLLAFLTRWFVIALLLKLTDALTDKLTVKSFGSAFIASLVISVLSAVAEEILMRI